MKLLWIQVMKVYTLERFPSRPYTWIFVTFHLAADFLPFLLVPLLVLVGKDAFPGDKFWASKQKRVTYLSSLHTGLGLTICLLPLSRSLALVFKWLPLLLSQPLAGLGVAPGPGSNTVSTVWFVWLREPFCFSFWNISFVWHTNTYLIHDFPLSVLVFSFLPACHSSRNRIACISYYKFFHLFCANTVSLRYFLPNSIIKPR